MPEPSRKEEARRRAMGKVLRLPLPARGEAGQAGLPGVPAYAELHCLTHFSFLRGASSPEELVRRACALGYAALAITDECSVSGAVQAWRALADLKEARAAGAARATDPPNPPDPLRLIHGSEFRFAGQGTLLALARDLEGWGDLCAFISACRRAAPKGQYTLPPLAEALRALARCERLWLPERVRREAAPSAEDGAGGEDGTGAAQRGAPGSGREAAAAGNGHFRLPDPAVLEARIPLLLELHADLDDRLWLAHLRAVSSASGCPLVAAGGVLMHVRRAKRLQDVMTAIRLGRTVADCGFALEANGERHLRPRERLAGIYPPDALAATLEVAARCHFRLDEVRYVYPQENVLPGLTPTQTLARLTQEGAARRFPRGVPPRIQGFIAKELALIAECRYEMFFLTVHDIVREARRLGILCQGRGSAANSVVCYCLGITAADPRVSHPLLERFISKARQNEPPDIDVDFEHERREEIIQYIYAKYGRERAALAASVITYRTRSALRDVGAVLGVDERLADAVAKDHRGFEAGQGVRGVAERAAALGVDAAPALIGLWLELAQQLKGHPRHLSQHVGGFVLTQTPLTRLVPVEPAAMEGTDESENATDGNPQGQGITHAGGVDLTRWLPSRPALRQVIQWDKDDLEALGWLKVDILALGMLTAVRRCLDAVSRWRGRPLTRADITPDDPATYAMICRADTVGVFQIESRAQMSMLPRLRPATFYDLVVQVAIVRPGPVTGGMVHPYLKARERDRRGEPIVYQRSRFDRPGEPPRLAQALKRTLGIPIFQEQVMELSMLAAGFSASDADRLRRAMATWKKKGGLEPFREKLLGGMLENGYDADFAGRLFEQIKGFGDYGFPESHAHSFALIAYESAWLKCHHPAAYLAAMLNSQPMGFYAPSQLVQDARRHGVLVRPPDVGASAWDCALEAAAPPGTPDPEPGSRPERSAVRLGLRMVKGLAATAAQRIVAARAAAPFGSVDDLARRAALDAKALDRLAAADALASLAGHRRQQVWQAAALKKAPGLLRDAPIAEPDLAFGAAPEGEEIVHDYAALGLTLRRHPLALLRPRLARWHVRDARELRAIASGRPVRACGIVLGRQRPGTAKGTIFVTLEDETGQVNVIVWPSVRADERQRNALMRAHLLAVDGEWQRDEDGGGQVCHLIARRFHDLTPLLGRLADATRSRDFH